jgi:hypothetical protein
MGFATINAVNPACAAVSAVVADAVSAAAAAAEDTIEPVPNVLDDKIPAFARDTIFAVVILHEPDLASNKPPFAIAYSSLLNLQQLLHPVLLFQPLLLYQLNKLLFLLLLYQNSFETNYKDIFIKHK